MSIIGVQLARQNAFKNQEEVQDRAVTVRPSSTALFGIDSADRYKTLEDRSNGTISPYSFSIYKNESLLNGFFTRIGLTEFVFPYYVPNINEKTDYISVDDNGGGLAAVLMFAVTGFYSPQLMASTMEAALIASTANALLTVVYNEGRFIFKTNTVDTISFDRGNFASPVVLSKEICCGLREL
jgi:hypothetical protein